METDQKWMGHAIAAAKQGRLEGGVPIGAALVKNDELLGVGYNKRVQCNSVIRHGETDCLENVGRLPASVYAQSTLYTTLSPCDMCTGAILLYKIPRVVIGENVTFQGNETLLTSRGVQVINLDLNECKEMMTDFIKSDPQLWNEDIGV
jgi:creatinine deaminase